MQTYDWSSPNGTQLIMTDDDVNRAVLHYVRHSYSAVEVFMNMAVRRPDMEFDHLNTLAQAAAMTASIVEVMQWGTPMDPQLAHINPHNDDWMRFVAVLLQQAHRLEVTLAQEGNES